MYAPRVIQRYADERRALIDGAVPGTTSARRLASLTDETLREHAAAAAMEALPAGTRWALVALGGYGAGALLPRSDLDLLVLCDEPSSAVKGFVEAVLYPLWDSGLEVGHQVRGTREQLRATRADIATLTATLTARPIAGDAVYAERAIEACAADARRRMRAVLADLSQRDRPGSPYLLEPNLKEGAGGRRDYDELVWTAAAVSGHRTSTPEALVETGLMSPDDLGMIQTASEVVAAARWALHTEGFGDLMLEDAIDDTPAVDAGAVQRALADTHHVLLRVRGRCAAHAGGRLPRDRGDSPAPADDRAFATPVPHAVLAAVGRGEAGRAELERAAWEGHLDALIPDFSELMTLRRPGIAHELTVGAHCLASAVAAADIVAGRAGDGFSRSAAKLVGDVSPLLVAALVHDVGKRIPGPGHAERSAQSAHAVAHAFGMPQHAGVIEALVRHHLLLAQAAGSRDLDDEDSVLRVADTLGDRTLLPSLFVLTAADSIATGRNAWTDWHAALIGKLAARIDAALSPEVDGAGLAGRAADVRDQALRVLADDAARLIVDELPSRYMADRHAEEIVRHARLAHRVRSRGTPSEFEMDVAAGPIDGSYCVTLVTRDRHGLFATLAGVLALAGLDILAAEAHGTPSGIALDTFTVRSATLASVDHGVWARVERTLERSLQGRLALKVRLAERAREYRKAARGAIAFDIDLNDPYAAVLTVRADDRPGLLHDVASAIAESRLEIVSATALTRDGAAEDTFRLLDGNGAVPRETGLLGQLGMRLRKLG